MSEEWNLLESHGRYDRYAISNEDSVWVCSYCGHEDVDPDEHDDECEVIDEDQLEDEDEDQSDEGENDDGE